MNVKKFIKNNNDIKLINNFVLSKYFLIRGLGLTNCYLILL
jgi:hypothetical protein